MRLAIQILFGQPEKTDITLWYSRSPRWQSRKINQSLKLIFERHPIKNRSHHIDAEFRQEFDGDVYFAWNSLLHDEKSAQRWDAFFQLYQNFTKIVFTQRRWSFHENPISPLNPQWKSTSICVCSSHFEAFWKNIYQNCLSGEREYHHVISVFSGCPNKICIASRTASRHFFPEPQLFLVAEISSF